MNSEYSVVLLWDIHKRGLFVTIEEKVRKITSQQIWRFGLQGFIF